MQMDDCHDDFMQLFWVKSRETKHIKGTFVSFSKI